MLRQVLSSRGSLGSSHLHTIETRHELAVCLSAQHKHEEAEELMDVSLELIQNSSGIKGISTIYINFALSKSYLCRGEVYEAEIILRELREEIAGAVGAAHRLNFDVEFALAHALRGQGRLSEAAHVLVDLQSRMEGRLGPNDERMENVGRMLADLLDEDPRTGRERPVGHRRSTSTPFRSHARLQH